MTGSWRHYPPIELPSPALTVLAMPDGAWAGGPGGLARYNTADGWSSPVGLPLRSVTALARGDDAFLAGGDGGIARSVDGGRTWRECLIPDGTGTITALALSPHVERDGTALAATLENGILRSTDSGQSWRSSTFGLPSHEVLAVIWGLGEAVLAATSGGHFRSPNAGRAWRLSPGTEGAVWVALAALDDGALLAVPEAGPPMCAPGDQGPWAPLTGLPADVRISSLAVRGAGVLLLGTADHGLVRSADGGDLWSTVSSEVVLSLSAGGSRVYAGTASGVMLSQDDGETWASLPPPPLHDLRRLLIVAGRPLVAGYRSPPVIAGPDGDWSVLDRAPLPLIGLFLAPDGALLGSTPDGLFRSNDRGASWHLVEAGATGQVTQMTFADLGQGWAGGTGTVLLQTRDGGRTWNESPSPFGVLPLVAFQARSLAGVVDHPAVTLIAATYDARRHAVCLWRSDDGGARWQRGAESATAWPIVATHGSPPLITIGNVVTVQQPDGAWRQTVVGEMGVRRVVSDGAGLVALAADGLRQSQDHGASWARIDAEELPADQVVDIALDAGTLYALLSGGRLWSRPW